MCRLLVFLILPLSLEGANQQALEQKTKKGDGEVQYQLAEALFWGNGVDQDLGRAAKLARASAEQGNAKGEYRLAVQLILGQGMESNNENLKKGFEWLEKASEGLQKLADQGDHDAQHKLALLFDFGLIKGEEDNPYAIDRKKAVDLTKKAANEGNTSAQFRLSLIHRYGLAVERSDKKSVEWLKKAADNGSAYAAYGLWMTFKYSQGQLVKRVDAKPYLISAAEKGLATAQYQYGISLGEGLLGGIDPEAGIKWVKQAAKQGLSPAQLLLGQTLAGDKILDQDLESSFVWLSLASNGQSGKIRADAKKYLAGIRDQFLPAKRLDLQQQVRNFKPKESLVTRNFNLGLQGAGKNIIKPMRVDLLTVLANKGNAAAMVILANPDDRPLSVQESIQWYKKAAEEDHKLACSVLADIYINGVPDRLEPDFPQGIKWLRKAAKLGQLSSMNKLGTYIIKGTVIGVKSEEGVKWVVKAAENGYAPAQTNVGVWCINGDLVEQNNPKAEEWLLKAASQKFSSAQFYLGQFYLQGRDDDEGKPNHQKAIEYYKLAARQGEARALYHLGMIYMDGMGVKKSFKEAYKWFVISRNYGMPEIDRTLARCAKELNQDDIRRAVDEAEKFRAQNYYDPNVNGEVVPVGKLTGHALETKANRGDSEAQFQIAKRYAAGDGVELNPVLAYKWFWLAEKNGHDKAKEARQEMIKAQGMSLEQIRVGRKLAEKFKLKDK
jgi:TPR repeat protein